MVGSNPKTAISNNQKPLLRLKQVVGLAIAGMALASCTPPQAEVPPSPTTAPTVTASPTLSPTVSPTLLPSPTVSPTVIPSPTVSPTKAANVLTIEKQVTDLVAKAGNLTVESVTCPEAIDETSGKAYDCQVQSDAGTFVVVVQPTGQAGKFRWGTRGLLLLSKLDTLIQRSVANQGGGKVSVDCGSKARTAKQGEVFDCKVTDAKGKIRTARITVRDELGNVYLTVL
ncbi:MAG: DUF4333 domain-containing protein [Oscillatoriales cyanobacterium C42_A2020_001]|nr:DUF4333 domain-containing protein [Leptolyngbyaceae cyanobacterium C42_A2020_001]